MSDIDETLAQYGGNTRPTLSAGPGPQNNYGDIISGLFRNKLQGPSYFDDIASAVSRVLGGKSTSERLNEGTRKAYLDQYKDPISAIAAGRPRAEVGDVWPESGFSPAPSMVQRALSAVPENVALAGNFLGPGVKTLNARPARLPMDAASRMARAKEMGFDPDTTWYHGSNRIDRVLEKGQLDPKRATSGPMPYFSENPEISSSYAMGKPDTSRMDTGDIASYFTISPKALGWKNARTPVPVEQSWHFLTPEQRATITERMHRIGYESPSTAEGPIILHPQGVDASLSSDHLNYLLKTEARGNPLKALRAMWHDGGELIGSEPRMADIWKLAGYPHEISQYSAPWTTREGVMPAKLRMERPLVTSNVDEIRDKVVPALKEAFAKDRTRSRQHGADDWDKNVRWTPKEWVSSLERDLAAGDNSYTWTSIPDKVTAELKRLGYDGIIDMGGKGGGVGHRVAIPFEPNQVRSTAAAFDPAKKDSANLLASHAAPAILGAAAVAPALAETLKQYGGE